MRALLRSTGIGSGAEAPAPPPGQTHHPPKPAIIRGTSLNFSSYHCSEFKPGGKQQNLAATHARVAWKIIFLKQGIDAIKIGFIQFRVWRQCFAKAASSRTDQENKHERQHPPVPHMNSAI